MTSYAAQKGRAAPVAHATKASAPRPLTAADEARIAANREFILEHMPEMLDIIRDHHAVGNIDGWRNIDACRMLTDD